MRREWALDLDMTGLALLQRTGGQWQEIATESLERPDIEARLAALLDDHGVRDAIKVFLPRSQILYTTMDLSDPEDASAEIEAALVAMTPYGADEIEFDWELTGANSVDVAAVALETLDEVRGFIEALGLGIAGFSSRPELDDFPRAPDFGGGPEDAVAFVSARAAAISSDAETEVPDVDVDVDEVSPEEMAEAKGLLASDLLRQDPTDESPTLSDSASAANSQQDDAADRIDATDDIHQDDPDFDAIEAEEPGYDEDPVEEETFVSARVTPPLRATRDRRSDLDAAAPMIEVEDAEPVIAPLPRHGRPLNPGAPLSSESVAPRVATDLPVAGTFGDTGRATAATLSRGLELTADDPVQPLRKPWERPSLVGAAIAASLTVAAGLVIWSIAPGGTNDTPTAEVAETPATLSEDPAIAAAAPEPGGETVAPPLDGPAPVAGTVIAAAAFDGSPIDLSPALSFSEDSAPLAAVEVALAAPLVGSATTLTLQLDEADLIVPAVVDDVTLLASFEPGEAVAPIPTRSDDRPALLLASLPVGADAPVAATGIGLDGTRIPPLAQSPLALDALTPEAPAAPEIPLPAATGPAVEVASLDETVAPPPQRDLALADTADGQTPAVDTEPPTSSVAIDGNASAETDGQVETAALESPDQTDALPEGDSVAAAVATAVEDALASVPVLPAPTDLASSLDDTRPAARPRVLEADAAETETATAEVDPRALFRPRARPASAQDLAQAQNQPSETAQPVVTASANPRARPEGLASAFQARRQQQEAAALLALRNARAPDTSAAITAALAPEPSAPAPAPRENNSVRMAFPTDASVAERATIEDVIRLNRINLVGVFGLQSDRRALIRLPSGRYVKVKVGDRVDGGQVAGISTDRLRYRKGGRTITLEMPSG